MSSSGRIRLRDGAEWDDATLYQVARMYYVEEATQAQVAASLGVSRSTVSRLLSEAHAREIVRIELTDPADHDTEALAASVASTLGLKRVWVAPSTLGASAGPTFAPSVSAALRFAELQPGDALLVSSGAMMHQVSRQPLPALPGVFVAPAVGGLDQPESDYQTNEITRHMAERMGATPVLLHAPALSSPGLYRVLMSEPSIQRVTALWRRARCALLGIGAPPLKRVSPPTVLGGLRRDWLATAVGDLCTRPFDREGTPLAVPDAQELIAIRLEDLRSIPFTIAVAGEGKVESIRAAARAGYINCLVTDIETARALTEPDLN